MDLNLTPAEEAIAKESFNFWVGRIGQLDELGAWTWLGDECRETTFRVGAVGDHGEAKGFAQWHSLRRLAILKATKLDVWGSHSDALLGANWEWGLAGPYRHVRPAFVNSATLWGKCSILISKYEQSSEQGRDLNRQLALAEALRNKYRKVWVK